jgi:hypothetical protein
MKKKMVCRVEISKRERREKTIQKKPGNYDWKERDDVWV